MLHSLPKDFQALIFGASGALGGAFVTALQNNDSGCGTVLGLSRSSTPSFDLRDESSIASCAQTLQSRGFYHLIIDATGALHIDARGPEKSLTALDAQALQAAFVINACGPALLMKHFIGLLPTSGRCIFASLSARVGSITDNELGGWYGYRASKAALNMLLRCAAIEASRTRPEAVFAALQPGTVASRLSAPFVSPDRAVPPMQAACALLNVLNDLPATGTAVFVDYQGHTIPW